MLLLSDNKINEVIEVDYSQTSPSVGNCDDHETTEFDIGYWISLDNVLDHDIGIEIRGVGFYELYRSCEGFCVTRSI